MSHLEVGWRAAEYNPVLLEAIATVGGGEPVRAPAAPLGVS